jgi:hypothetical protein
MAFLLLYLHVRYLSRTIHKLEDISLFEGHSFFCPALIPDLIGDRAHLEKSLMGL